MAVAYGDPKLDQGPTNGARIYRECLADGDEGIAGLVQGSRPANVLRGEPGMAPWDALPSHVYEDGLSGDAVEPVAQNPTISPAFCVGSDDQGMAYNFLPAERDQLYLMPPSLRDWLPKDHLALFVLDVVDELDLSGFYERYRKDGLGRAAYEPSVMVCVLLYAYCVGERSSRRIERRCTQDVAFRVLSVNQVPDHATIARFLASHEEAFSLLFCQVLALCATAGLVKLGIVALDGTKMAANASGQANATRSDLEAEAKRIVAEAIATDQEEDARYGDARGDELPADLCDPRSRRARIAEAKARLDEEDASRQAELAQRLAAKEAAEKTGTTRGGGRPLKEKRRRSEPRANITDPDSTIMRDSHGYLQGYNAQAAVTENQIILAAHVTQEPSDNHQLAPVVTSAQENLMVAGVREPIGAVVADAG